ncbi:hypothetical protein SAMN05216602_0666 [Pseudomonas argentinensis]|uniref:Uncharacterized protein n=2 Tax=Phytopseudomonas argentinensis TaxID=289370 RepID=A0A1I3H733_9GAMM|nr:hypothetical protein SAMN05216602_0666 [Pseudomonas argentinensis]
MLSAACKVSKKCRFFGLALSAIDKLGLPKSTFCGGKMSRLKGVTENYWNTLHEDKKFRWRFFSRVVMLLATFSVSKIGVWYLDLLLSLLVSSAINFIIDSQRSYTKHSPVFRKNITRILVFLGSWSVTVVGVFFFAFIAIQALVSTFSEMTSSRIDSGSESRELIFMVTIFLMMLIGVLKVFRDLKFEELIHVVPKQQLKRLLVYKEFRADSFPFFAYFEIAVVAVACIYLNAATTILAMLVSISNLWF